MFRFSAAALLALAASAVAYQVTKPENGSTWDPNEAQIIAWNKVSTDPSTFAITLVHQASQPNTRTLLLDNVDGGSGSVTVNPPNGGWPSGTAYQINFVQDSSHLDSLLAQSQQFDIKASTGSSSSSSSSSASSSSASSASRSVSSGSSPPLPFLTLHPELALEPLLLTTSTLPPPTPLPETTTVLLVSVFRLACSVSSRWLAPSSPKETFHF
ncbi:hypothetical protein QCA50_000406 [Cerrena zonata]|uniref:Yeast cell wall synthesis Kre9/Knh1-like N-terminal domain-containing protein n=1 Tax=Cerrena zonata TaxID=2478898 RepID=A0AAW0GZZ0_9APHY